ncbi:hypothetical protein INT46_001709 [Mucor plumbeus]|uniref:Glutamine amidotransferase type-2 domain-containing protein n=1 Tax=Mucor plumbeus TaxID=97098 RepID=A0A8H7QPQ2_9FUNG|nr:hypothetical protein INT46_001709 [Mucor plumbeus]
MIREMSGELMKMTAFLITRPKHSIVNQSFDSRLRLDTRRPLNGDGFGVGWYDNETPETEQDPITPCIFTSVTPAWNNVNLVRLAEKIRSPLVFAHVRASTSGAVSETNCHPWSFGRLMWMHNGGIAEFDKFKRKLQNSLPDELFLFVQGSTDSEWAFALFLSFLKNPNANSFEHQELKEAMLKTVAQLNAYAEEYNITEPSLLNFAVTDGQTVVCLRYISSRTEEAASLYFSSGTRFECYRPGHYRMVKADRREDIVVVASEPLTFEKADWLTIPTNNILVVTPKLNVLLQPIKDKFYTPERGMEVKINDEDVAIIPEPKAQLFKAQAEEQMQHDSPILVGGFGRPNKRIIIIGLFLLSCFSLGFVTFSRIWFNNPCSGGRLKSINEAIALSTDQVAFGNEERGAGRATFFDLNQLQATSNSISRQEKVLILTPLKNAAKYLPRYFELIDNMKYPKHLINIAFLVSDTTDDTVDILRSTANRFLNRYKNSYDSITIYEKDFKFELPEDKRHDFELQPLRRSYMARSRNYLLTAALRQDHAWVLWLDVDVIDYPDSIIEDLQSVDVDVVVPNCLRETDDNSFWGYDKNNWQETEQSRAIQEQLDPEYVLLEGYFEFLTGRYLMVDMPTHGNKLDKVPLDGVGATFTLVKANVHREGANFPAYAYQHQVETEGFAKMAKAMGFGVYGLPAYLIYHINNS